MARDHNDGGFVTHEALYAFGCAAVVAAFLAPIFMHLNWRWTAIPTAIILAVYGVSAVVDVGSFARRKSEVWGTAAVVIGISAYILYQFVR